MRAHGVSTHASPEQAPFRWNGRGTERLPDLDCLGLLFRAWETANGTPWRRFPVNPLGARRDGEVLHAEPGGTVRTQALRTLRWDALLVTRLTD